MDTEIKIRALKSAEVFTVYTKYGAFYRSFNHKTDNRFRRELYTFWVKLHTDFYSELSFFIL